MGRSKHRKFPDEHNVLFKISKSIISTLDYEKVLQIISDGMSEMLEIETAAIFLLEDKNELYLGATTPPLSPDMPDALRRIHLKDHLHINKTLITRKPHVIIDTKTEALTQEEKKVVELRNLRSLLYLPFIQEENVLGVLILGTSNKSRTFSTDEIDYSQTIANQLSIGIQNARLHLDLQLKNKKLEIEINERKKAERALRNSEAHLSNALRIAKLGHWEYDIKKNHFIFTDEFYEIYHTSAQLMNGYIMTAEQYTQNFLLPEDQKIVANEINKGINITDENFSQNIEHKIKCFTKIE